MDVKIFNKSELINSLQVSVVKDIPQGDFDPKKYFLIKNNTDEDMLVTIVPAGQSEPVTTYMYIGWNPELVKKVINALSGLQYGY